MKTLLALALAITSAPTITLTPSFSARTALTSPVQIIAAGNVLVEISQDGSMVLCYPATPKQIAELNGPGISLAPIYRALCTAPVHRYWRSP